MSALRLVGWRLGAPPFGSLAQRQAPVASLKPPSDSELAAPESMRVDSTPILLCFAVEQEARPFRRLGRQLPTLRLLVTGMGRRNAETAVRQAWAERAPARVLTAGFAGGLNPALKQGEIVFEDEGDPALGEALRAAGARPGRFHCADRIAVSSREKTTLWQATGADAVEMESGWIRALCRARGVPAATVRVISDAAQADLPLDFNALLTPAQRMDYGRLLLSLLRHPGSVPRLIRFQREVNDAAGKLARVLAAVLLGSA